MKLNDSNVTIMVKNMDKSIRFYETIGLKLKQRWEDNYAMISGPGVTIGLHPSDEKPKGSGSVSIGFMLPKIETAIKILDKAGIKYKFADGGSGKYTNFKDPDGTHLYFVEPKWQ